MERSGAVTLLGSPYTHAHESVGGTPTIYVSKAVVVVQCFHPAVQFSK